jgi:hypothetical protein
MSLTNRAGSPHANFDIGWSSPDFVGPGCALEKFIISGGPGFISGGAEFSLGRKEKAPAIKRNTTYFESLSSLLSSYVVLYDTLDDRAWLSNGLHTLLHLVRTSLREDQKGDFSDECLLSHADLDEGIDVSNPKAAISFLKSRRNLEQPVFPTLDEVRAERATVHGGQTTTTDYRCTTTVRLKDRVCQIMEVLWQLIDHQATLDMFASGLPVRLPRGKLEGYRFMEVATRGTITPRVVHLRAFDGAGKSWVDLTRAIRAVTLFGEGFGDLITPHSAPAGSSPGANGRQISTVCHRWKKLPKNKDYLAASSYDLARILRQEGSAACSPIKLAPGIFWNQSFSAFESCACETRSNNIKGKSPVDHILRASVLLPRRSCDRVQVLLPTLLRMVPRGSAAVDTRWMDDGGAVVFGKSELFPWRWPDVGDPKPEDPAEMKTGGRDASFLLADGTSVSASASTRASSTSGDSRGATTLTESTTVSLALSSQGGSMPSSSLPSAGAGTEKTKRGLRKLWKSMRARK